MWQSEEEEPKIYHVDINLEVMEIESATMAHGTGGPFAHNILEAEYSENLTPRRALALAPRALMLPFMIFKLVDMLACVFYHKKESWIVKFTRWRLV
ncbi:unnamed protein product [Cuscuta campestris]|uniref:Uncharacterized protein n=1 Tax=Cuscuta campestris TaxID=132261 RepID=A0A484N850_9ASTE|nr:unnamed protein product [Cuscuta campestris]